MATDRRSSTELEHDADRVRAQLAATLDEVRARISPGQILDEVVDYARDSGGGDFVRNFSAQIRANPLPVTLVGAGLAWLMMGRRPAPDGSVRTTGSSRSTEPGPGSALKMAASDAVSGMRRTVEDARDSLSNAYESVAGKASEMGDSAAAMAQRGANATQGAAGAGTAASNRLVQMFQEQPLVFGAIGIGLGAALGALFPSTKVEDALLGQSSDALKSEAKGMATEQYEAIKEAGEKVLRPADDETARHGIVPDHASSTQLHDDADLAEAHDDNPSEIAKRSATGNSVSSVPKP